ncbi:MAU2 chromatid cohesion factor [Nymphon striatum]|nr:MAU2 chromatid cohesion factor [Nymphon striatum]
MSRETLFLITTLKMASSQQDAWYLSLLGLAEHFRTSNPPNIRLCIHCLQSVFTFKLPPRVEARTHLQLGNILLSHTKNTDLAKQHLEQAWFIAQTVSFQSGVIASFDDIKFEAASVLADLYEKQSQANLAKPILRKAIEISQTSVYWHCRLLLQLAQIHSHERDYVSACSLLGVGSEYASVSGSHYTRILFLLSKGMLLLIDKKFSDVHPVLSTAGNLVENWQGSVQQKELLKVFFLVLQVCHFLMAGQVKSVRPCLKQLQQSIQTITVLQEEEVVSTNQGDMFQWMPKEHMCVLVYLVSVMHSMQAGYMDKAQKYTDKALMQIEKLKSKFKIYIRFLIDSHPILLSFQLMLIEHIVMCRLVMGNKSLAIQEVFHYSRKVYLFVCSFYINELNYNVCISHACQISQQHPKVFARHRAQIHTLLGLYAMSMNCMDAAEAQFNAALRLSTETELWTFVNLNLAIVYLRTKRDQDLLELLNRINPEALHSTSHCMKAAAFYVQGLQSFFQARYNDAKRYLRETLKMANAEDLNRLTSCSLVLLGHIFLSLGNSRLDYTLYKVMKNILHMESYEGKINL